VGFSYPRITVPPGTPGAFSLGYLYPLCITGGTHTRLTVPEGKLILGYTCPPEVFRGYSYPRISVPGGTLNPGYTGCLKKCLY